MFSLTRPTDAQIRQLLRESTDAPYSYPEVGVSRGDASDARFVRDHQRGQLGTGEAAYLAACQAINEWKMFPTPWTAVYSVSHKKTGDEATGTVEPAGLAGLAPEEGTVVALVIKTLGLWSQNACRIVHTFDETGPTRRYGFAYGTLPTHVETGEEQFAVEWDEEDRVWYDLRAWSRPRHWLTWVGFPIARLFQAKFRRESLESMQQAVAAALDVTGAGDGFATK